MPVLIALQLCGKFFNCFRANYLEESIVIFLPCKIAVENNKHSPPSVTGCWAIRQQELTNHNQFLAINRRGSVLWYSQQDQPVVAAQQNEFRRL